MPLMETSRGLPTSTVRKPPSTFTQQRVKKTRTKTYQQKKIIGGGNGKKINFVCSLYNSNTLTHTHTDTHTRPDRQQHPFKTCLNIFPTFLADFLGLCTHPTHAPPLPPHTHTHYTRPPPLPKLQLLFLTGRIRQKMKRETCCCCCCCCC